ncbi:pyridoxamine 5'-phosphate oxidase family protein [Amycolatopsis sp. OK19-0408]|uniref:Pyridoxamine 5'-phosphate oxidase family protein n=1 Tax=Amycolatopsis iheyensis TaxID=2945988 RepID=A0A9X2NAE9_9PSEU|nr:pyridoxamine 5'-phosphate oxidase family protein [Amycolatopsis iheyensis]MCR6483898.1 pyridoxamine 5'-phosphate oxidase family protein [Amycolatopsis iheyensis]
MVDDVGFGLLLDRAQCLALLRTASLGRVIFTHRAMPAVRPVRFTVVDDAVVFAVPTGSPLYAGARDAVVAFEADDFAADFGAGWYVSLLGRATESGGTDGDAIACLCPCPSLAGRRFLRIPVEAITGHRISCHAE